MEDEFDQYRQQLIERRAKLQTVSFETFINDHNE